jgi:hypothetical protein
MKKPEIHDYKGFDTKFREASAAAGKPRQATVPYFIASHPGSDLDAMIDLALFLKRNGYRPDQVQDFIPAPFDIATCMYHTGIDPFTGEEVHVSRSLKDRRLQRALLQFFKPENYFEVREALLKAGRADLIGSGCDALIPANPPKPAIEARRRQANRMAGPADADHYHSVANPARGERPGERGARSIQPAGYRPGRRTQKRRRKHGDGQGAPR